MVPRGLEPRTLRLLAVRSNQLSYETCWHKFYSLQIKKHSIIIHVFNAECFPLVCNAGVYLVVLIKFEKCLKARLAQSAERNALQEKQLPDDRASFGKWSHAGLNRGPYGH